MSSLLNKQIPPPALWEEFEELCCDLWRNIWKDENTQMNGRRGQAQHGVDVFGQPDGGSERAGVQCKGKDTSLEDNTLTEKELRAEVTKAKKFTPNITKEFIIATTGPRDANVQKVAREITKQHQSQGLFSVHVWFWDDICKRLADFEPIVEKHYPDLYAVTIGSERLNNAEARIIDEQSETEKRLLERLDGIDARISANLASSSDEALTTEYQRELDYSRQLIHQHKPKDAISYLEQLRERVWDKGDDLVKFRILTNLGASKIRLENIDEGAKHFIEALQYNEDDEKALLNAALGHNLIGQNAEAEKFVRKVLEKNPANTRAYAELIQIHDQDQFEDIIALVPSPYDNSPEIAHAIGVIASNRGMLEEARQWFELGLKNGADLELEIKPALGATLVDMISSHAEKFAVGQIDEELYSLVERAAELFTEAWDEVKDTDLRTVKHAWLAQRGIVLRLKDDLEQAGKDLDLALELSPNNPVYKKYRALIAQESGDVQKAVTLLEELVSSSEQPEVSVMLADIYKQQGRIEDAVKVLSQCIERNPDLPYIEEMKRSLLYIHLQSNNVSEAEIINSEMRAENPTSVLNLIASAQIAVKNDQREDAVLILKEANTYALDSKSIREVQGVAEEFQKLSYYAEAAVLYEMIADTNQDSQLTRNLIYCYFKIGRLDDALELCKKILDSHGLERKMVDITTTIYEEMGNLASARELFNEYLTNQPEDEIMRLRQAEMNFRTSQFTEVDGFLNSDIDTDQLSIEDKLRLAELYCARRMDKQGIDFLYEIRRSNFNVSIAHTKYVVEFFNREKDNDEWLNVKEIGADTAVCLQDSGGSKEWYIIEDREDADLQRKEIKLSHPLAQQLIGKKKNDTITMSEGRVEPETYTIVEVLSKYVRATQDSMASFEKLFPGEQGLHQIRIPEPNPNSENSDTDQFEPILRQVRERARRVDTAENIYKEGKFSIGAFANAIGVHPLDVWSGLMHRSDVGIKCCVGSVQERDTAIQLLENQNKKIVIDLISLVTSNGLQILDTAVDAFGKLGIAQSTIDELQQRLYERQGMQQHGMMVIGQVEGQYTREEITPEQVAKNEKYLENLIEWIWKNCEILPVAAAGNMDREHRDHLEEVLGKGFLDTVLIASEPNRVLWSDDHMLRILGQKEYGVEGVWTQIVLMKLVELGKLDSETYHEKVVHLGSANYRHTAVNLETIIEAGKQSKWEVDFPFTHILRTLSGNYCDEDPAIKIAVNFVHHLWLESLIPDRRDAIIIAVVNTITEGRNRTQVLEKFWTGVQVRFRLLPLAVPHIGRILKAWEDTHIM